MSIIKAKIESVNRKGDKVLTIFLTAGFPNTNEFTKIAVGVIDAGADILEIGLPFADSLADGPIIQSSYTKALRENVNLSKTLGLIHQIKMQRDIPIVLMSSSNPLLNYGLNKFVDDSLEAGVNGVIIPDVPLEEYGEFFQDKFYGLDTIMLTTPTSSEQRIRQIDDKSSGFLYCVSVVGTTGVRNKYDDYVLQNLERTYKLVDKNKMQIGFGISTGSDVKRFHPYCDGVIVGSAIVKSLGNNKDNYDVTFNLVKELKSACKS